MMHGDFSMVHHVRVVIAAAAHADGVPLLKALLRFDAVAQVPFSGECTVIAVLRQNVRIGGLSFQIGNWLPFLLIALEIRIFLSLGGKFLAV